MKKMLYICIFVLFAVANGEELSGLDYKKVNSFDNLFYDLEFRVVSYQKSLFGYKYFHPTDKTSYDKFLSEKAQKFGIKNRRLLINKEYFELEVDQNTTVKEYLLLITKWEYRISDENIILSAILNASNTLKNAESNSTFQISLLPEPQRVKDEIIYNLNKYDTEEKAYELLNYYQKAGGNSLDVLFEISNDNNITLSSFYSFYEKLIDDGTFISQNNSPESLAKIRRCFEISISKIKSCEDLMQERGRFGEPSTGLTELEREGGVDARRNSQIISRKFLNLENSLGKENVHTLKIMYLKNILKLIVSENSSERFTSYFQSFCTEMIYDISNDSDSINKEILTSLNTEFFKVLSLYIDKRFYDYTDDYGNSFKGSNLAGFADDIAILKITEFSLFNDYLSQKAYDFFTKMTDRNRYQFLAGWDSNGERAKKYISYAKVYENVNFYRDDNGFYQDSIQNKIVTSNILPKKWIVRTYPETNIAQKLKEEIVAEEKAVAEQAELLLQQKAENQKVAQENSAKQKEEKIKNKEEQIKKEKQALLTLDSVLDAERKRSNLVVKNFFVGMKKDLANAVLNQKYNDYIGLINLEFDDQNSLSRVFFAGQAVSELFASKGLPFKQFAQQFIDSYKIPELNPGEVSDFGMGYISTHYVYVSVNKGWQISLNDVSNGIDNTIQIELKKIPKKTDVKMGD